MLVFLSATQSAIGSRPRLGFAGILETFLLEFAHLLEVLLESVAILVVAAGVAIAVRRLFLHKIRGKAHHLQEEIRLKFGQTLALSLEFQLAADIVATAVSPTWEELGKLAVTACIRTFLNYFLQQEVRELQEIAAAHRQRAEMEEL